MQYSKKKAKTQILTFRTATIAVIIVLVGGYGMYRLASKTSGPDERVALAECLSQKNVTMYGAYWCPHCARQKKAFGAKAWPKVDYVECAIPGNRLEQTQACKDANIQGYPTWVFPDGTRRSGEIALTALAEETGCAYGDVEAQETIAPSDDETMVDSEEGVISEDEDGVNVETPSLDVE